MMMGRPCITGGNQGIWNFDTSSYFSLCAMTQVKCTRESNLRGNIVIVIMIEKHAIALSLLLAWVFVTCVESSWEKLTPGGSQPAARYGHSVAMYGRETMIMSGGTTTAGSGRKLGDVWGYNFKTDLWEGLVVEDPCVVAGGTRVNINGANVCKTPVKRTKGSSSNTNPNLNGNHAYNNKCLDSQHTFTWGSHNVQTGLLCHVEDTVWTNQLKYKTCTTKYPEHPARKGFIVGSGIVQCIHGNCPSCPTEEWVSQIMHVTCKAMLGDNFIAYSTSYTSWTFYSTTAVNTPGFDSCGTTGSHTWGQTQIELSGKCGGYYKQLAFITEVGCIETVDHPLTNRRRLQSRNLQTKPAGRSEHATNVHGNKLIMFGGDDGTSKKQDTWSLNLQTKVWTEVQVSTKPGSRSGHTSVLYDGKMIVFGGYDGTNRLDDLWELNLDSMSWSEATISGSTKPAKRDSMTSSISGKKMFVFGGDTGSVVNDLWELNLETYSWNQLTPSGAKPEIRRKHAAITYNGVLFIMGGWIGSTGASNDLWSYNPTAVTKVWKEIDAGSTKPSTRYGHTAIAFDEKLYVFGGYQTTDSDIWGYQVFEMPSIALCTAQKSSYGKPGSVIYTC